MTNKPPKVRRKKGGDDGTVDLAAVRRELDDLRKEALSYGYALEGEHLAELRTAVERMRAERQGRPPCYRRAYSSSAPQCRICDLRTDCAGEPVAAYVAPGDLQVVACKMCEQGMLRVELADEVTGAIRDYACSSPGCTNTLLMQARWEIAKERRPASVYGMAIEPDTPGDVHHKTGAELKKEIYERHGKVMAAKRAKAAKREIEGRVIQKRVPLEVVDKSVLDYVRANQPVHTVTEITRHAQGSHDRVRARVAFLVSTGVLSIEDGVYRVNED
jgi:hypothetical protein